MNATATATSPMSDYQRVITAKFGTTRKGDPIRCRYCTAAIVVGRDLAAVDALGWHNVCTTCSGSRIAQVVGLVTAIEAAASTATGAALDSLMAQVGPLDSLCTAAIAGDDNAARLVTPALFVILEEAQKATKPVDPFGAEVERLRAVTHLLIGRDISFAQSLVTQWDTKGYLSDRQRPYVLSLTEKGEAVASESLLTPLTQAILARVDGRPSVRFAIPSEGHNDLDFIAVFAGRVERHLGSPGDVAKTALPTAQAVRFAQRLLELDDEDFTKAQARYGSAMHFCGRCGSPLTDLGSRTQGFGPECIKHAHS